MIFIDMKALSSCSDTRWCIADRLIVGWFCFFLHSVCFCLTTKCPPLPYLLLLRWAVGRQLFTAIHHQLSLGFTCLVGWLVFDECCIVSKLQNRMAKVCFACHWNLYWRLCVGTHRERCVFVLTHCHFQG